ncbi:MAG: hypothetical protein V3V09_05480 [Arenicellales bacterium]
MHNKAYYKKLRKQWAPDTPRLIVIAESPPADGDYIYKAKGSRRESLFMELLIQLFGVVPKNKADGLRAMQQWGIVLLDATYTPLYDLKPKAKNQALVKSLPALMKELNTFKQAKQTPIILIKKNVCDLLEGPLLGEGFNVVNDGAMVPFPGSGQQGKFRSAFSKILAEHIYAPKKRMVTKALKVRRAG